MILDYKVTMLDWILSQADILQGVYVSPNDFNRLLVDARGIEIVTQEDDVSFTITDPIDSNLGIYIILHPHIPDCKHTFL